MRVGEGKEIGVNRILCISIFTYALYSVLLKIFFSHFREEENLSKARKLVRNRVEIRLQGCLTKAFMLSLIACCLTIVASLLCSRKILLSVIFFLNHWTLCVHCWLWGNGSLKCFPGGTSGKETACQCKRCRRRRFNPWIRKILWRRKWQPTLVFLPEKFHGQRRLGGLQYIGSQVVGHDWSDWAVWRKLLKD